MKTRLCLLVVFACTALPVPVAAGQSATLACRGDFNGWESEIHGQRSFEPVNNLGDGYVRFGGELVSRQGRVPIGWEGYTRTAPFAGVLSTSDGDYGISVLDATGGQGQEMIIYDGRASLGPPTILGRFRCSWR